MESQQNGGESHLGGEVGEIIGRECRGCSHGEWKKLRGLLQAAGYDVQTEIKHLLKVNSHRDEL